MEMSHVISEPMKKRTAGDMIAAYRKILDNEISEDFNEEIENHKCTY